MPKPIVAVVGRPNVGKSTLFNRLTGRRIAIVEDTPGITRDRLYADGEWNGRTFTVIDTGGISMDEADPLQTQIRVQAEIAMEEADVILAGRCWHVLYRSRPRPYPGSAPGSLVCSPAT